jgi:hypothetical protein
MGAIAATDPTATFEFDETLSPVLLVSHGNQWGGETLLSCEAWAASIAAYPRNHAGWEPWSEGESQVVTECDSFPCKVKLDAAEVASLAALPKDSRMTAFKQLVFERRSSYLKSGARKEYEFKGALADPVALFTQKGFMAGFEPVGGPALIERRLDFAPGKFKVVRQILDRRLLRSKTRTGLWLRDVYNTHYFDGWGEWISLECVPGGQSQLNHVLMVELDTLKSKSFLAKLGYGRMKSGVKDGGQAYLKAAFAELSAAAQATAKSQASSSAKSLPEKPSR